MRPSVMLTTALLLIACADAPTTPPSRAAGPRQQAIVGTINEIVPFTIAAFVPCANDGEGEVVILTGEQHLVGHGTFTENGNVRFVTHIQTQNVSGTGEVTGDRYRLVMLNQSSQGIEGTFPFTFSFVDNIRVIGQGPDNDFWVHQDSHITIDANGEVRVLHDNIKADCNVNE